MLLKVSSALEATIPMLCCEYERYEFDFMRGDEDYKYRFGGVNRYVMRVR